MRGRYGPAQAGQNQEKYGIPRFAKTGVKQYPLIDCHKGTSAVEKMMSSDATRKKFISDAVAKMKEQKFHGYISTSSWERRPRTASSTRSSWTSSARRCTRRAAS